MRCLCLWKGEVSECGDIEDGAARGGEVEVQAGNGRDAVPKAFNSLHA